MITQNLWHAAKAVLRGKFMAIQSYIKKQEKHRLDNLTLHLKQLEKEEEEKKISRRKEIIKNFLHRSLCTFYEKGKESVSCLVVSDSLCPHGP